MEQELREFGLSDNEIKVYLTLLKAGVSTANRIAELTGIKRSTTYDTLRLLAAKGIVSTHSKESKNYFECAPPRKLLEQLEYKEEKLQAILPKLEGLQGSIPTRSSVAFFEGKKGVLAILNDVLDTGQPFLFYGSRKSALYALQHYPENFIQKRAEMGIKLKAVLAEEDRLDPVYDSPKIKSKSELRYLTALNSAEANTFIYGTKVAFMSSGEDLSGVIIESTSILKQQKRIFELLWKVAKP